MRQRQWNHDDAWVLGREELVDRFGSLPADRFPHTRDHAAELTSGTVHDRFDFTVALMLDSVSPRRTVPRRQRPRRRGS